jgi:Fur family transcriptional regulator, ferric uptake regulator
LSVPVLTPALQVQGVEEACELLRARGLRLSAARRLVIEALVAAGRPVRAEEIAGGLRGRLPRSDLASVYRNLETLETHGLVRHLHLGHGPGLYALAGEQRELLLCESCFRYIAVESGVLDGVRDALAEATCWQARFSHFPLTGLCPDCA